MIDKLKFLIRSTAFDADIYARFIEDQTLMFVIDKHGEILKKKIWSENYRSDNHQLCVTVAPEGLEFFGSPARLGQNNNVFGSGDIMHCWRKMVDAVQKHTGLIMPLDTRLYQLKNLDITHNYAMSSKLSVYQFLEFVEKSSHGHFKVTDYKGSKYVNATSTLRRGKVYGKGDHMTYMLRKKKAELTVAQLGMVQNVVRLELSLMPQYFRELGQRCDDANDWWQLTEEILNEMHYVYWTGLLGKEVKVMVKECELESDIMKACYDLGLSDGQGKAAYRTWALIKSFGANIARESMSRPTFYRHRKILMAAGLRNADFYTGKIIPFNLDMRMSTDKVELAKPVESWEDLHSFLMIVNG